MGKTSEDRELAERVCGWIRYELAQNMVSQNEMARRMRMGSGALSRYMSGERTPACGFVLKAARALHSVTTAQLLFESPPPLTTGDETIAGPRMASGRPAPIRKRLVGGGK